MSAASSMWFALRYSDVTPLPRFLQKQGPSSD
jgi:hypothetical protein